MRISVHTNDRIRARNTAVKRSKNETSIKPYTGVKRAFCSNSTSWPVGVCAASAASIWLSAATGWTLARDCCGLGHGLVKGVPGTAPTTWGWCRRICGRSRWFWQREIVSRSELRLSQQAR